MLAPNEITITADGTAKEVKEILTHIDHLTHTDIEQRTQNTLWLILKQIMTIFMLFHAQFSLPLPPAERYCWK